MGALFSQPPPPNKRIFGFFNPVLSDLGRFRAIFRNSADFREILRFFPEIPDFFDPFLEFWWDLALPRRSGWEKAARGCPRIQICSHEVPNQSQNNGFESDKKPWFCSSGKQEGQGSKRTRTTPCASETGHFVFFQQKHAPWKNGMPNW